MSFERRKVFYNDNGRVGCYENVDAHHTRLPYILVNVTLVLPLKATYYAYLAYLSWGSSSNMYLQEPTSPSRTAYNAFCVYRLLQRQKRSFNTSHTMSTPGEDKPTFSVDTHPRSHIPDWK